MMKYKLGELVDTRRLQEVLDNLYAATGIPSGIIATDGNIITATGWRDICTKFHRANDLTCARCIESDMAIKNQISAGQRYVISKCKNGMVDIGTPIRVNGEHIATMFQGQFFFEEPDLDFFKKQARAVGFNEEAYLEAVKATPVVSVLFLDLDNFKNINDVYGHQIGDAVLISVAKRLKNLKLPNMTLSRFGGDEFVVLFETTDTQRLKNYAKEMLHVLETPFSIHQKIFHISASIGVASYPEGGQSAETLLKNADMSMYIAKQNGKNNFVCFKEEMDTENKRKRTIEESLNRAINNNEFFLVYQPKVRVDNNKIFGVEALIRWSDPKEGIISPMEFIPVAEGRGLIKKIDRWVIHHVIQQKKEWETMGYNFGTISINISPNFLMDGESIPYLKSLIEKQAVNPRRLQFEITENILINSYKKANATILALKELGFSIALDDFGKGYSSLSYLKRLPVDNLKIDKLFIDEMLYDEQPIIDFIIGMGQRLNMNVIAEGVETKEQLETLKRYGCDMYQGYFFSKPLTKEDIIHYF